MYLLLQTTNLFSYIFNNSIMTDASENPLRSHSLRIPLAKDGKDTNPIKQLSEKQKNSSCSVNVLQEQSQHPIPSSFLAKQAAQQTQLQ